MIVTSFIRRLFNSERTSDVISKRFYSFVRVYQASHDECANKAVMSYYHHDDYDTNDNDNNDNNDNDVNDGEEEDNDNDEDGDNVVVFLGFFISTVLRCRSLSKTGLNVTADLV